MAVGRTSPSSECASPAGPLGADTASDAALLEKFLDAREEAAFAALVRRHGPMVMGVCRRVLGNAHDAEDAFQATFFVLARKAASVSPRTQVANFLHGVAYRCALAVRTARARRHAHEVQAVASKPESRTTDPELLALLDSEINRLPAKYRLPILLCDLGGKSRRQTAAELGWREGTVAGRLARARALLTRRLKRHCAALTVAALAALLAGEAGRELSAASVLAAVKVGTAAAGHLALAGNVSTSVATLGESVVKALFLAKLKVAMVIVLAVGIAGGAATAAIAYKEQQSPPAFTDRAGDRLTNN